jgi:hypothetical protein
MAAMINTGIAQNPSHTNNPTSTKAATIMASKKIRGARSSSVLCNAFCSFLLSICLVPGKGLEPPLLTEPAPKAGASTDFATQAFRTSLREREAGVLAFAPILLLV